MPARFHLFAFDAPDFASYEEMIAYMRGDPEASRSPLNPALFKFTRGIAEGLESRVVRKPLTERAPAAKRDKSADEQVQARVLAYLVEQARVCTGAEIAKALGCATAEVSAAKKALLKDGKVTDPGKGKMTAKAGAA